MNEPAAADGWAGPTRCLHDRAAGRVSIVVDVLPASVDDVGVHVGTDRAVITVDRPARWSDGAREHSGDSPTVWERVDPPAGFGYDVERATAVYHNGVLEVTLDLVRGPTRRGAR